MEQFWTGNEVRCPDDDVPLRLKLRQFVLGGYALSAECPLCGEKATLQRGDDPRRQRFRRWTAIENRSLALSAQYTSTLPCPVCETSLTTGWITVDGADELFLQCLRCGNSNLWRQILAAKHAGTGPVAGPQACDYKNVQTSPCLEAG